MRGRRVFLNRSRMYAELHFWKIAVEAKIRTKWKVQQRQSSPILGPRGSGAAGAKRRTRYPQE